MLSTVGKGPIKGPGPASRGGDAGFTLIEVITAMGIAGITIAAFLNTFAYGTVQVEELGRRRQALAVLEGEMEYWRARFRDVETEDPVRPDEADVRNRQVMVDPIRRRVYKVESVLSPVRKDRDLRFQAVTVLVSWQRPDADADTMVLESRMYAR